MPTRFTARKVMLIRHAEKPNSVHTGISPTGKPGKQHLTTRGWQRAGALAALFAPPGDRFMFPELATPSLLFASKDGSRRSMQTLIPLSDKLRLPIKAGSKGEEAALVDEATAHDGTVLISWQRELIPAIAAHLLAGSRDAGKPPALWPPDCFDVIWVFDLETATGTYRFRQVPQRLLSGDSETAIETGGVLKVRAVDSTSLRVFQRLLHPEISKTSPAL